MQQQLPVIKGYPIDDATRCKHYHSAVDIIAIKFKCCQQYYPCYQCHAAHADHEAEQWLPNERDTKTVLCGVCNLEMTIDEYLSSENICSSCGSAFNPKCSSHYNLYFL